jgi:hypothetical protein
VQLGAAKGPIHQKLAIFIQNVEGVKVRCRSSALQQLE